MAHRNRVRSSIAAWETGAVTPAEFNAFDEGQWKALGEWGGVFALEEELVLGGAGVVMAGDLTVENTGEFVCDGDATFGNDVFLGTSGADSVIVGGGEFIVESTATFDELLDAQDATVHGDLEALGDTQIGTLSAPGSDALDVYALSTFVADSFFEGLLDAQDVEIHGTLEAKGDVVIGTVASPGTDDLEVYSTTVFVAPVSFEDPVECIDLEVTDELVVGGPADFQGLVAHGLTELRGPTELGSATSDPISVIGTMTMLTALAFSGNGRVPFRTTTGPDSNATFTVADANVVRVPTLTGTRSYQVQATGAQDGDWMLFFGGGGASLNISCSGGQGDTWSSDSDTGVASHWTLFIRVNGTWRHALKSPD